MNAAFRRALKAGVCQCREEADRQLRLFAESGEAEGMTWEESALAYCRESRARRALVLRLILSRPDWERILRSAVQRLVGRMLAEGKRSDVRLEEVARLAEERGDEGFKRFVAFARETARRREGVKA